MIDTRIKKALRDLWLDRSRTAIVVVAIAIGIFCLGTVIVGFSILDREINANYLSTSPASATLYLDSTGDNLSDILKNDNAIKDSELRRSVTARVLVGPDTWQTATLYVPDDFGDVRINTMHPENGSWPTGRGEIAFERMALPLTGKNVGDRITVRTSNGVARELNITGTVHDTSLTPANMAGVDYAYVSKETLADLGGSAGTLRLMIVVAENGNDESYIRGVADRLKGRIEQAGGHVSRIEVPRPGEHQNAGTMSSLMFMCEAFSALALVLSMVLVINMITGFLSQQVRQIGIMKAIGGTTGQLAAIYLGGVFAIGVAATAIGLPAGVLAGRWLARMEADMLNFEVFSDVIPLWVYAVLIGIGLILPLLAAAYPVYRGSRISVNRAINDYGIGAGERQGPAFLTGLAGRIPGLSRPLWLSIRNTFRRRERLALTLLTLAVGGALFMVAMSLMSSMDTTVNNSLDTSYYSDIVSFASFYPAEKITPAIAGVPGVDRIECVASKTVTMTTYADDAESNPFSVLAVPPETGMVRYPIIEGRWLQTGDRDAIVLNHVLVNDLKEHGTVGDVNVGDEVTLNLNGSRSTWHVVGIVREMLGPPRAYVNYSYFTGISGNAGLANAAVIRLQETGPGSNSGTILPRVEDELGSRGMNVSAFSSIANLRMQMKEHLAVIVVLVMFMSGMSVVVGMLGLASTMGINLAERRREIGVMRAIGASRRTVARLVAVEALVVGLMSWLIAVVLAVPLSYAIGSAFGMIFFKSPLDITVSIEGLAIWLAIVVVLSPAASLLSARKAAKLPVHEVLAYE